MSCAPPGRLRATHTHTPEVWGKARPRPRVQRRPMARPRCPGGGQSLGRVAERRSPPRDRPLGASACTALVVWGGGCTCVCVCGIVKAMCEQACQKTACAHATVFRSLLARLPQDAGRTPPRSHTGGHVHPLCSNSSRPKAITKPVTHRIRICMTS